ncbi:hypothetical protein G7046_g9507 [Stylonectria norvegica]|nr:hypothetical protein G7046_g9507 [Stylonectria norvegica]
MTRPTIIRADTIDLQDHAAPSAKDHSKNPLAGTTSPDGSTTTAPHQAETIREVISDKAEEELHTPRISWTNGGISDGNQADIHQYAEDLATGLSSTFTTSDDERMTQEDALAIAQNGGVSSSDEGDLDGDADDMDDDMMDKISSSPSIEDGGCRPVNAPPAWPRRVSSLPSSLRSSSPKVADFRSVRSLSPYLDVSETFAKSFSDHNTRAPFQLASQVTAKQDHPRHHHLLRSEYDDHFDTDDTDDDPHEQCGERLRNPSDGSGGSFRGNLEDLFYDCDQISNHSEDDKTDGDENNHENDDMPLMIPYEESFEDDDDSELSLPDDPRFIDSGWAGECLQDLEDIDFEFVYALHTFVATVEGQANATKGDTMVLLDDSNSYWWLVRVVKDSSIGYLPAEHIETPTERLARLNKHRNVDLSATMLGDQAEKKQPSFKTKIRRRKTVTFAAPTYVDYSDFDYSSDEEDLDDLFAPSGAAQQQSKSTQQEATEREAATDDVSDEGAKVEPLKPRATKEVRLVEPTKIETVEEEETMDGEDILMDSKLEGPSRSRNGTVRNTDSFFKDESVETKKITLTPNLLRDDNQPRPSTESVTKDLKARTSMDKLDKELMSDKEKKKSKDKDKKEKEKKPSAIRSFFSRKDKKKTSEDDDESFGKRSMDTVSDSQGRDSEDPSIEEQSSPDRQAAGLQRNTSKLQKPQPRTEPSLAKKGNTGPPQQSVTMELASYLAESRTNDVSNVPPVSMRIVDPETQETQNVSSSQQPVKATTQERAASAAGQRDDKLKSALKVIPRSASAAAESRPPRTTKARARMDLDELDSSEDEVEPEPVQSQTLEPVKEDLKQEERALRPQLPGAFPDSYETTASVSTVSSDKTVTTTTTTGRQDRLSESPVEVSPVTSAHPPALEIDTSSQEGRSSEETPSPSLALGEVTPKEGSSTRSVKEPSWDDAKLRAFFDEGEHVRDLLVVVYDKTDVVPAGKDHPVAGRLFREQNAKLAEITTQLDNMLGDWLARKQRMRGTV